MNRHCLIVAAVSAGITFGANAQTPVGTTFTYQGFLKSGGSAYNGAADVQFRLYDVASGGVALGGTLSYSGLVISDGLITASLNFGSTAFDGNDRWLEIAVRAPAGSGSFTTLTPRQKLAAAPYALWALNSLISGTQPNQVSLSNASNSFTGSSLAIDGGTLFVDSANNRVGIGTAVPSAPLHVRDGASGVAANPGSTLALEKNAANYLNILAPNANETGVLFGKPTGGAEAGGILYNNAGTPDGLQFRTNGNIPRMVISSDGSVGIGGITGPAARFDVFNGQDPSVLNTAIFRIATPGSNYSHVHNGPNGDWYIRSAVNGGQVIIQDVPGNVGIGTNSPEQKLSVSGGVNIDQSNSNNGDLTNALRFGSNSGEAITSRRQPGTGQYGLDFYTASAQRMVITNGGNVGIGTAAPSAKLEVAGNLKAQSITLPVSTRHLSLPACAFTHSTLTNIQYTVSTAEIKCLTMGVGAYVTAPVSLPDGAVITSMTVVLYDACPTQDTNVHLVRQPGGDVIGEVFTSGSSGYQTLTDNSISLAAVDNVNYSYGIGASWIVDPPLQSQTMRSVVITYTVTSPLP